MFKILSANGLNARYSKQKSKKKKINRKPRITRTKKGDDCLATPRVLKYGIMAALAFLSPPT